MPSLVTPRAAARSVKRAVGLPSRLDDLRARASRAFDRGAAGEDPDLVVDEALLAERVVTEALLAAGASDLDVLPTPEVKVLRVEFTGPEGDRGVFVVRYGFSPMSDLTGRFGSSPTRVQVADLGSVLGSGVTRTAPGSLTSNDALRALRAARLSVDPDVLDRAYRSLTEPGVALGRVASLARFGDREESGVDPHDVRVATGLLTDLASGAPVEWAVRRATGGGR